MLESPETREACPQEGLDPVIVQFRVLVADAVGHQAAGAIEQPRSFEQLVARLHGARALDFLGVQSINKRGKRRHRGHSTPGRQAGNAGF